MSIVMQHHVGHCDSDHPIRFLYAVQMKKFELMKVMLRKCVALVARYIVKRLCEKVPGTAERVQDHLVGAWLNDRNGEFHRWDRV